MANTRFSEVRKWNQAMKRINLKLKDASNLEPVGIILLSKLSRAVFAKRQVVFSPLLGTFVLETMIVISLQRCYTSWYVVECGTVFTFTGKSFISRVSAD